MFRFLSHCSSDSYIGSCAVRVIVRMPPNGAMCAGSCSSAHVTVPPRFGVALLRAVRNFAAPADLPRAGGPAGPPCRSRAGAERCALLHELCAVDLLFRHLPPLGG